MKQQLTQLITEIEQEVYEDIANGTTIPDRYADITQLISQAKQAIDCDDYDSAIELIGDINIDLLEQVDEFDNLIGEIIVQLHHMHALYISQGKTLPSDIQQGLNTLKSILDNHKNISQVCH